MLDSFRMCQKSLIVHYYIPKLSSVVLSLDCSKFYYIYKYIEL